MLPGLARLQVLQAIHRTGHLPIVLVSLLFTLVHGLLLFAAVQGTRIRDSRGLLWANQMRELTSLGKEVIKGVTEVGNMVLIQRPVLPLSLAQTLHQLCGRQRTMSVTALALWPVSSKPHLHPTNPTSSLRNCPQTPGELLL